MRDGVGKRTGMARRLRPALLRFLLWGNDVIRVKKIPLWGLQRDFLSKSHHSLQRPEEEGSLGGGTQRGLHSARGGARQARRHVPLRESPPAVPENSRAAPSKPESARSAYKATFFSTGWPWPVRATPETAISSISSAWSPSKKNLSSSSIALADSRPMSCRSPSKCERPGGGNF